VASRNLFKVKIAWALIFLFAGASTGPVNGAQPRAEYLQNGQFRFHLTVPPNGVYEIEASTNLVDWTVIGMAQPLNADTVTFTDPQAGCFRQRFYRGLQIPFSPFVAGEPVRVLVKPRPGKDLSALHRGSGANVLHRFPSMGDLQILRCRSQAAAQALVKIYQHSDLVQYAELDQTVQALNDPNDFLFRYGFLWNFKNDGQEGGVADADVDGPEAWDVLTSAPGVIVAVIDTGVRYTHEDLAANMWTNSNEIPGNGLDDDCDGYVDDVHGINAILSNGDPNDDYGHGTHVAGIIGAVGNNGLGGVGVCWRVQIMACKFLDPVGDGTVSDAVRCIDYARSHGAHIINASWGSTTFTSQALSDAIASARDANIIFVAACGNSQGDSDVAPLYPASYKLENVLAVASTNRRDELASFSNYGLTNVHLAAPGEPIYSCWNDSDSGYQYHSGTSMSAAFVSGACALVQALHPGESWRQIIQRVLAGVDQLPSLSGKCITGGRLNLVKALGGTPAPALPATGSEISISSARD
jgi:subtilisin family serine protease